MLFSTIAASLLALFSVSSAATIGQKRDDAAALYAYGDGISGLQVYFGNGLAYLGNPEAAENISMVSNVTFTIPNTTVIVSSVNDKWNASSNPSLFINQDGFSQVGFLFWNETQYSNMTTTGFTWYGSNLGWYDASYDVYMKFWAVATDDSSIWHLYWNSDSSVYTTGTPVSLRSV